MTKRIGGKRAAFLAAMFLALLVFLFSLGKVLRYAGESLARERSLENLRALAVTALPRETGRNGASASGEAPGAPPGEPAGLLEARPSVRVDLDQVRAVNPDIKAWLTGEDTPINFPVLQSGDNAYYLRRGADGSPNAGGSIFLDYRCPSDFSGRRSILYGHHMSDGSMFAALDKYASQDYYERHPALFLFTPAETCRIELFAGAVVSADSPLYDLEDDDGWERAAAEVRAASLFSSSVTPGPEDRLILLSTCSSSSGEDRLVLLGRLAVLP